MFSISCFAPFNFKKASLPSVKPLWVGILRLGTSGLRLQEFAFGLQCFRVEALTLQTISDESRHLLQRAL